MILYIIAPKSITMHTLKKCITVTNAVPVPRARAIRLISAKPPGAIDKNIVLVRMGRIFIDRYVNITASTIIEIAEIIAINITAAIFLKDILSVNLHPSDVPTINCAIEIKSSGTFASVRPRECIIAENTIGPINGAAGNFNLVAIG